jgi:hypothetical protein
MKSELPHIALYRPNAERFGQVNSFVVASARPLAAPARVTFDDVPGTHQAALWNMLSAPTPVTPQLLAGGLVITDAVNPAAHDFAKVQLDYRRSVVDGIPPGMLMN